MQIEHKTEKGTLFFVKVPDYAYEFNVEIDFMEYWFQLTYIEDIKDEESGFNGEPCQENIDLPKGNWQLIGLTSEVTEEQAKMMVPLIKRVYGQSYYDYTIKFNVGYGYVGTALESFKSLMKDKEIYEVNPFGTKQLLIKNDYTSQELRSGWDEKQSRTGKWIVLFKPSES